MRIKRGAARQLARLPRDARQRLVAAIDNLADEPLAGALLKGGSRGSRRLRVGHYRIVYEVLDDELVVLVIRVARRREAYR